MRKSHQQKQQHMGGNWCKFDWSLRAESETGARFGRAAKGHLLPQCGGMQSITARFVFSGTKQEVQSPDQPVAPV